MGVTLCNTSTQRDERDMLLGWLALIVLSGAILLCWKYLIDIRWEGESNSVVAASKADGTQQNVQQKSISSFKHLQQARHNIPQMRCCSDVMGQATS